jgi:hypothetical protein
MIGTLVSSSIPVDRHNCTKSICDRWYTEAACWRWADCLVQNAIQDGLHLQSLVVFFG